MDMNGERWGRQLRREWECCKFWENLGVILLTLIIYPAAKRRIYICHLCLSVITMSCIRSEISLPMGRER